MIIRSLVVLILTFCLKFFPFEREKLLSEHTTRFDSFALGNLAELLPVLACARVLSSYIQNYVKILLILLMPRNLKNAPKFKF